MVKIVFESYGTSQDNETGNASGHFDVTLSKLGERQAKELEKRYSGENFDAIFCSDLQRSYKTAQFAFANREFKIIKDPRIRECDYGKRTGGKSKEIEEEKALHISKPFPNGESYNQTSKRIKSFLKDLLKNYNGKKVMIIGHRATQYGLEHWIKGKTVKQAVTAPWKWQPGWIYQLKKI